jgi:hypothetical protein
MTKELCDPCCRDDVQANATTLCTDCEEFLCDDCARAHRRNKLSLAHVLLDVKQIESLPQSTVSSQTLCDMHQATTLYFYCPQHEISPIAKHLKTSSRIRSSTNYQKKLKTLFAFRTNC